MNYSKGNWEISKEYTGEHHIAINIGKSGLVLLERHVDGKDDQDIPNAQLISAAPDMYETLNFLLQVIKKEKDFQKSVIFLMACEDCLVSIAKAEGKL